VKLGGGQLAIIVEANSDDFARPRVLVVTDAKGQIIRQHHLLDLAEPCNQSLSIVSEVANGTSGIDVKSFIEQGLKLV